MNDINKFFFELIQVAIGTLIGFSHTLRADDWSDSYVMAFSSQKQIG